MDPEILQSFVEEIAEEMPAIRRGILVFAQHGGTPDDLALPLELTRTIHSGASMFAITEVEECAANLGFAISAFGRSDRSPAEIANVLDLLSALEEAIIRVGMAGDDAVMDVTAFVDESFDQLTTGSEDVWPDGEEILPDEGAAVGEEDHRGGFEIDEELLEVFAMEAEGLLKNMHSSLEAMYRDPQDKAALWEIRRNAHTFKGAAGIVGFKKPSELAHRVEDLLDRLAGVESFSTVAIIEILQQSTDCLQAMTNGDSSAELAGRIAELYRQFDQVLETTIGVVAERVQEPLAAEAALPAAILELPSVAASDGSLAEPAEVPATRYQKRHVVRVSLSRLDELARINRDLLIGRSVFEQRLKDLEQQIDELHNATRRLQNTSNRLEIDFEASMLSSGVGIRQGTNPQNRQEADHFDELEFDRYTGFHQCTRQLSEAASDTFEINNALDAVRGSFVTLFDQQRQLVEEMQEKLVRIRMVEFGSLASRLQRVIAVTCEDEGKKARITIENEKLELDTQIIDALTEPLLHLLKNAVVHGIESPDTRRMLGKPEVGEVKLTVSNEDTHVVLTLSDDGRGIASAALKEKAVQAGFYTREEADAMTEDEALQLIFRSGLTTAEKLSLSAGRGVGMSIVRESIDSRRGTIVIESSPQRGSTFTLRLPVSLAITNVLLVKVGRQTIAIPAKPISHITELRADQITADLKGNRVIAGSEGSKFHTLAELVGQPENHDDVSLFTALQLETGGTKYSVAVDSVMRTEEVIIKPLGDPLDNVEGVLGAALLGNGDLVAILDLPHLLKRKMQPIKQAERTSEQVGEITVMVVDDSPSVRHMTSKIIANAGWVVLTAKDGIDALEQLDSCSRLPSVILSDIEMPRMDGYELLASIGRSETFRHIPVVMITSRAGTKHREKAFESGVSEYLTKPFEDRELIDAVKKLSNIAN